jgi:hypothetical protein
MKKTTSSNKPVSFGRRKGGKAAKSRGPKCKKVSKYRGQGR